MGDLPATGLMPGCGTYFCLRCGSQLSLQETDRLPKCPDCGGSNFRRDSIFTAHQEHGPPTVEHALPTVPEPPDWLQEARGDLRRPGHYLAMCVDDGEISTFAIERGWTRIGRSERADLRLDDPTVSRRHALVVAEPGKELRVLDDRSLNGVFVNGAPIEWEPLRDGDELAIGRYRLYALRA